MNEMQKWYPLTPWETPADVERKRFANLKARLADADRADLAVEAARKVVKQSENDLNKVEANRQEAVAALAQEAKIGAGESQLYVFEHRVYKLVGYADGTASFIYLGEALL